MESFSHPDFVIQSFLEPQRSSINNLSTTIATRPYSSSPLFSDDVYYDFQGNTPLPETTHFQHNLHIDYNLDQSSSSWIADLDSAGVDLSLDPNRNQLLHTFKEEIENKGEKKCRKSYGSKKSERKKLKPRATKETKKVPPQQPLTGYVHVRARRGEATDPHSLAERVRRKKISMRMKLLQSLVPGCDKITGKAHILDQITRYVITLQNQVEFLAAKLGSGNGIGSDFEVNTLVPADELIFNSIEAPPASMLNHQETTNVTACTQLLITNTNFDLVNNINKHL